MGGAQEPFFGGVPVAPDVALLMEALGVQEPGTVIVHAQVERVLGLKSTESRYRTVVARWMVELWDDANVRVVGVRGGFKYLSAEERLDQSEHQRRKGVRRLTQAVKEVATTPIADLPPEQVARHQHLSHGNVLALMHVKEVQRVYGLALKKPPESLLRHRHQLTADGPDSPASKLN